ncbi:MAG: peptidoglycan-binding protein [Alphaproteobacteria bacterium]|nr:peptidoglycan-binding protein [Alphaproteobacteria bacterium]MDE1987301.1 peptidoglycan-binding protein [Alphaproteobacteria bacterium]MDE2163143.1 peptidoglycan-binding protein [Alphaproteobacteria bacterium]MDE2265049.1 peptidoglycan-binding protein [Alphaproteobacteria bacterium]MDE2500284.1 peptidoglycan-binding protein [Alphaproteobacteria bacterium]
MRISSSLRVGAAVAFAAAIAAPSCAESIHGKTQRQEAQIPTCTHKIGTAAIYEPENKWWVDLKLESPEALIKVFVMRSGCFTLVDRGKGFSAVQQERELAGQGELRQGSNIGRGQIKAADYVIVPDVVSRNADAGGSNIGGILGGIIGGGVGAIVSNISINSSTADVVLTVTDVRSSEQVAMEEGHGSKSDLGFGAGGGGWWGGGGGALGVSSYQNTQIGQVVALAYIDAYTKLVTQLGGVSDNASADNAQQAVTMSKPGRMYEQPGGKGKIVRSLDPGMMLYPTGNKDGVWWEVSDELGNKGWVSSVLFQLAK